MANVKPRSSRRPYSSAVRDESARRTRRAVVAAAAEMFVTRGYGATSLADVAVAAGVARPTVFAAFGSKCALLREVLDQALAGDDELLPVAARPWFQPVWDATTPAAVLDAYAAACAVIGARGAGTFEAARRAAGTAEDAGALWEQVVNNRRAGARQVVDHLLSLGPIRRGLGANRATDLLWLFNDPAHYDALVNRCGWPPKTFTTWLAQQMRSALL
jgi:AcrR family transcriptional regulator